MVLTFGLVFSSVSPFFPVSSSFFPFFPFFHPGNSSNLPPGTDCLGLVLGLFWKKLLTFVRFRTFWASWCQGKKRLKTSYCEISFMKPNSRKYLFNKFIPKNFVKFYEKHFKKFPYIKLVPFELHITSWNFF